MNDLKSMLADYQTSNTTAAAISTTNIPELVERMTDGANNAVDMILRSLSLNSPYRREENIVPAHQKTLEWLFSPDHKFLRWLSDPSASLFWGKRANMYPGMCQRLILSLIMAVTGKPGAGKSTLMKFVSHHPTTIAELRNWAGETQLIVARFYFWGGNPQQSTLEGLLQSLLHEITLQCPQLISVIAPERWTSIFSEDIKRQWTMYEVERSLERFIEQETISCRTAVFIDGLDEFTGDQDKLQELLDKLQASNKIKLCLASRPLNRFEEAYGRSKDTMLRVHELTEKDIIQYASDLLEKKINLGGGSSARGGDTKEKLMRGIVERADGVFLWVNLVVHSLSEGLTNADTIDTLRDRLDEIPRDLELLFKKILDSVDKNYWKESSMIFQMATTAKFALPAGVYSVVYEHEDDYCLRDDLEPMDTSNYKEAIKMLKTRLAARTRGLLEIGATPKVQPDDFDFYAPHVVIFLHRTVKDFLSEGKIDELLRSRLHGPFDPDLALCRGLLVQLKRFTPKPEHNHYSSFQKALNDLVFHAKQFEVKNNDTPMQILDQAAALGDERLFYRAAIQHDLYIYLAHKLQKGCKLPRIAGQQPLLSALVPNNDRYECASSPRLIQLLLEYGANPNDLVAQREEMTVWEDAVKQMLSVDRPADPRSNHDMFEIFQIMLHWKGRYPNLADDIERKFGYKQSRSLLNLMRELDAPDGKSQDQFNTAFSAISLKSEIDTTLVPQDVIPAHPEPTPVSRGLSPVLRNNTPSPRDRTLKPLETTLSSRNTAPHTRDLSPVPPDTTTVPRGLSPDPRMRGIPMMTRDGVEEKVRAQSKSPVMMTERVATMCHHRITLGDDWSLESSTCICAHQKLEPALRLSWTQPFFCTALVYVPPVSTSFGQRAHDVRQDIVCSLIWWLGKVNILPRPSQAETRLGIATDLTGSNKK